MYYCVSKHLYLCKQDVFGCLYRVMPKRFLHELLSFTLPYLAQINLEFLFIDKKPQYIYMCNIQLRFLHSMNAPTVYQVLGSLSSKRYIQSAM